MRIITGFLTAALCVSLTACGGAGPPGQKPPLAGHSGNFEATASIHRKNLKAAATLSQPSPDAFTVAFSAPDSLEGMVFAFGGDSVDVSYKGLSFQFDPRAVSGAAVAKILESSISMSIQGDGVNAEQTAEGTQLRGTSDAGEFILLLDPENDVPLKLLVPSEELEIEFVNFRFLD